MTEQPKVTKAEAYDLLGDLLNLGPADSTSLFGDAVERKRSVPRPTWKAHGLVVLYKETQCLHCGTKHRELNPLVLLHEQLVAHDGQILRDQKTSNPLSIHINIDELPEGVKVDTYPMAPIHFCYECIESFKEDIHSLFKAQLKGTLQNEANEANAKLQAATNAKLKAEQRLMQLAESFEDPLNTFEGDI